MNSAFVIRGYAGCCTRTDGAFTIMAGQRGATGRPGTDSGGGVQTIVRPAGEVVSALRVVIESRGKAYLVGLATESVFQTLGVSLTTGEAGADLIIQTMGFIDDPAWSWSEGLVFCGAQGVLTQIPPTEGWELVVGFASSPTRLNLGFNEPVHLA